MEFGRWRWQRRVPDPAGRAMHPLRTSVLDVDPEMASNSALSTFSMVTTSRARAMHHRVQNEREPRSSTQRSATATQVVVARQTRLIPLDDALTCPAHGSRLPGSPL